ncbi:MAG: hypothetical protein IJV61_04495 [Paludibacteraceae bacterium]|nr:hypothetical protein [Paludibacteraceae bacterium]
MKEQKLVTLEEMKELLQHEAYNVNSPLKLLRYHKYAEELLLKDYRDVNWTLECPSYGMLLDLAKTWMRPLVWKDLTEYQNLIIDGRVAAEEYFEGREEKVSEIIEYAYDQLILGFADSPLEYEYDDLQNGYLRGMHNWLLLTWDLKDYIDAAVYYEGEFPQSIEVKSYLPIRLRYSLTLIAEERGGKRAAELLRLLQKEWPSLKRYKTNFEVMSKEEIEEFEEQLFSGFDDILEEWEAGDQDENAVALEQKEPQAPKICRYICAEKIKETGVRTVEEYIQELEDSCVNAPTLADTLLLGKKLGYLNFHGDGKSAIYKHLKECYPGKIKFGYTNFTLYFLNNQI